jgi:hypothetical protein
MQFISALLAFFGDSKEKAPPSTCPYSSLAFLVALLGVKNSNGYKFCPINTNVSNKILNFISYPFI